MANLSWQCLKEISDIVVGISSTRQICFVFEFCISNGKCSFRTSSNKSTTNNIRRGEAAVTTPFEETKEQQDRLRQLTTNGDGGKPTQEVKFA